MWQVWRLILKELELYSPREIAKRSGWPEGRIRRLLRSGSLRHVRMGECYLLPESAIHEYVANNMFDPKEPVTG
ncbi:excisionase family DNA-binding protein [Paracoccus pantotrophus]